MSRALMESLRTDMKSLAKLLESKGRKGDKILAHISPKEAALLKKRGGAGTKNPDTGLPEFAEGDWSGSSNIPEQTDTTTAPPPVQEAPVSVGQDTRFPMQAVEPPAPAPSVMNQIETGAFTPPAAAAGTAPVVPAYNRAGGTSPFSGTGGVVGSDAAAKAVSDLQTPAAAPADPSKPGFYDQAKAYLANPANALRLGLTGATGLLGVYQQNKMAEQNKKALTEQKALARPYQEEGKRLMAQAQRGELSAAGQQAYQNAIQQANQAQAQRGGGISEAQVAGQLNMLYNQLIENQYKYGIQVAQIGDQIQLGAIQNGLKLDQQLAQTTQNFYASLASTAAGMPPQQTAVPRGQ